MAIYSKECNTDAACLRTKNKNPTHSHKHTFLVPSDKFGPTVAALSVGAASSPSKYVGNIQITDAC